MSPLLGWAARPPYCDVKNFQNKIRGIKLIICILICVSFDFRGQTRVQITPNMTIFEDQHEFLNGKTVHY